MMHNNHIDKNEAAALRLQLIESGYCRVSKVAPPGLIENIRRAADAIAEAQPEEEARRRRLQGSIISVHEHEEMVPIIALPEAIETLRDLGFTDPRFSSGYIISKQPETAPALFWHQDGILWDQPISYASTPHQLFLMFYLIDTNRDNGCLRVIPGSHRKRHRLHGLPPAHTDEIQNADSGHPALQPDPDEVDVPVRAGDLVIGDARLLHSAHPNRSRKRRTVITLWFCPQFAEMPENIRAFYDRKPQKPPSWSDENWDKLKSISVSYSGSAEPARGSRIPDARLV